MCRSETVIKQHSHFQKSNAKQSFILKHSEIHAIKIDIAEIDIEEGGDKAAHYFNVLLYTHLEKHYSRNYIKRKE